MTDTTIEPQTELEVLRGIADDMGLKYRSNLGVDKLQKLIDEAGDTDNEPEVTITKPVTETIQQRNVRLKKEANALVRVNVVCMNPNKRDHENGFFSVSNSVIGTICKLVMFNTSDGWHIPNVIYEHLKSTKCQVLSSKKMPGGKVQVISKMINEFAIEVLPPLTQEELDELATQQALSGSIE